MFLGFPGYLELLRFMEFLGLLSFCWGVLEFPRLLEFPWFLEFLG